MGWSYCDAWTSAKAVHDMLRRDLEDAGHTVVKASPTKYGRNWWAAVAHKDGTRSVFLALVNGHKATGFGYKDMDESMGPCEVDCPLSVLDAAGPDPAGDDRSSGWAREWRGKVRAYHAARAVTRATIGSLKPGDVVSFRSVKDNPFTVARRDGRKLFGYGASGRYYRLPTTRAITELRGQVGA